MLLFRIWFLNTDSVYIYFSGGKCIFVQLYAYGCLELFSSALNFRLLLMNNPLKYKMWVTKRRLHVVHAAVTTFGLVQFACAFIFLHKDFTQDEPCVMFKLSVALEFTRYFYWILEFLLW